MTLTARGTATDDTPSRIPRSPPGVSGLAARRAGCAWERTERARRRDVMGQSFSLGRISGIRIGVNYIVYAMTH